MPSRRLTNRLNWLLDNLVPPLLRDSRLVMGPLFWLLFGRKARTFMSFKESAPFLDKRQFAACYADLADVHLQRETDLSPRVLDAVLTAVAGDSALDVGSGRGFLVRRLAEQVGGAVAGVDLFAPASGTGRGVFVRGDVEALPFGAASFDTVTCCHTLEHVQDATAAVRELRRVARRRLVVVVPRQREYAYTFDLHIRFFPYASSLHQMMRGTGAHCVVLDNDFVYVEELGAGA